MKIETVDITTLTCDPANVRKHGDRNMDTLRGSLQRFEQQKPIVVDADGVVVAGNGTLEAAKALGWDKIKVIRTKLKGTDRTAFSIADNRTAELAEWMPDELGTTLAALKADGVDLDELGFTDKDMAELCGIVPNFAPSSEEEQGKLDEKNPITCPHCGEIFTP
jgi:ParB family chromosome partitioning protein